MFWKKKATEEKRQNCKCPVPGCGLDCPDKETLRRHISWAHPAKLASYGQTEAPSLQQETK